MFDLCKVLASIAAKCLRIVAPYPFLLIGILASLVIWWLPLLAIFLVVEMVATFKSNQYRTLQKVINFFITWPNVWTRCFEQPAPLLWVPSITSQGLAAKFRVPYGSTIESIDEKLPIVAAAYPKIRVAYLLGETNKNSSHGVLMIEFV